MSRLPPKIEELEALIAIFNLPSRREVEKYARTVTITSEALTSVLMVARVEGLEAYQYTPHFSEYVPSHLEPTEEERSALALNGVGPLKGKASKMVSKISQIFIDRRLLAAHLFYSRCHKHWHLIYFDQRDAQKNGNHWIHGPHIHYSSNFFTNESLTRVWGAIRSPKPSFPKSVHLRYDYHHNRGRS